MEVHQATVSAAVRDRNGNLLMECILETKADTLLEFVQGLHGTLSLAFEEGTLAAWLHDLLKPHVNRVVVCDSRKAAMLRDGNKNDRIDARNLSELLRTNQLKRVYHEEHRLRTLKELGRSYLTVSKQLSHDQQRDDSHDEPNQIPVSQLGDSVCWHHGLCSAPSPPVVGQDRGTRSSGARRTFV
jgi:transposase